MVSIGTIRKAWQGKLLYAPCLKDLETSEKPGVNQFKECVLELQFTVVNPLTRLLLLGKRNEWRKKNEMI